MNIIDKTADSSAALPTVAAGAPEKATAPRFVGQAVTVAAVVAIAAALWLLADVLLLAFGAVLLSIALRGLARALNRRIGGPVGLSLGLVTLALLFATGLTVWVFGSQIANQYDLIISKAPVALTEIKDDLGAHPFGRYLLQGLEGVGASTATGTLATAAATVVGSVAKGLAYAVFVAFGGVYLAVEPGRYRSGLMRLVPPARRRRYGQLIDKSRNIIERWLLGQLFVMATIGALSGFGLWALGIDAAFALGVTGGLLCFVPFVGAILAAVPAILMAFVQSPIDAAYVALLFMAIHFVEGNIITPFVQDEAVSLPPLLSVFSTLVFTILFGPFAVIVAVPITLVGMVTLEMLYAEDALGEAPPPGLSVTTSPADCGPRETGAVQP